MYLWESSDLLFARSGSAAGTTVVGGVSDDRRTVASLEFECTGTVSQLVSLGLQTACVVVARQDAASVVVLDRQGGKVLWSLETMAGPGMGIVTVVGGDPVLWISSQGFTNFYDLKTGEDRGRRRGGPNLWRSEGLPSQYFLSCRPGVIAARSSLLGRNVWERTGFAPSYPTGASIFDGRVFRTGQDGEVLCTDLAGGADLWKCPLQLPFLLGVKGGPNGIWAIVGREGFYSKEAVVVVGGPGPVVQSRETIDLARDAFPALSCYGHVVDSGGRWWNPGARGPASWTIE